MSGASVLLAKGWWRGMRRWWTGTAVVLALVQVLLLSVAGVFSGMEAATHERVEAFFTGDVRVTRDQPAAAPDAYWNGTEAKEAARLLGAGGATVTGRLESQFVLSRRTLLEAYLEEDEQYKVRTPGGPGADTDFYGLGIVVGFDPQGAASDALRPYLLPGGRFPQARPDVVELVMGQRAFLDYVGQDRTGFSTWPPPTAQLEALRFEITSGRVDQASSVKDLIRMPARVVGLFDTGLDALDTFTLLAHRDAVARLLDLDPAEGVTNAFTVHGHLPDQPWAVEDAQMFAGRYIGQMVDVVKALGVFLAVIFVSLPLFLVWHGLGQLLQMHHREYAVCRAVGVGTEVLAKGILILVGAVSLSAILLATAVLLAVAAGADVTLARYDLPLPVRFQVRPEAIALTLASVAAAMAVAVTAAVRRIRRQDLPSALRAP